MTTLNYFTCTLGQAVEINDKAPHEFRTINEFLRHQARVIPRAPAVGFPVPSETVSDRSKWRHEVFTFQELDQLSIASANLLDLPWRPRGNDRVGQAVALLCPSSLEFLLTWLGLLRLGYSVLLIAPQCQPPAIAHLCVTCDVTHLVYHHVYADLAQASADVADHKFQDLEIPEHLGQDFRRNSRTSPHYTSPVAPEDEPHSASDVACLFHTSGTSSGLPKPIPQSHSGAIGVLPCLPNCNDKATFTTTPLYHGGIADCFRAWTSGALVWLFPGKDVPITASNILKSLASAEQAELRGCVTPVRYFSSVPYVLQMISAESEGMKMLQGMDIVGIGGAALPQDAGDSLVHNGVNLVSRFGSAECGFLLSSHRDYENDKEWQYLRSQGSELLMFEKQQDGSGLSELVIRPEWPHMAKRNREDGSLATADLFKPHPNIKDAWKYHSRADSQLTLITGKKFDPAPLEAVIASSAILSDVLIFGNGMQSAGALLFRSPESRTMAASQVLDEIWPTIDRLNKEGQAHTRLSRSMLTVMDSETSGLEKSSKGTVLRVQAEKRYEKNIHDSYTQNTKREDGDKNMGGPLVPEHEIPMAVLQIIKIVLGTNDRIAEEADLFSHGVDSVACMAIRAKLQSRVLDPKAPTLPLNVVYDCGNIKRLSKYLVDIRHGRLTESEDEIQLMKDLATQYSSGVEQLESLGTSNGIVEKDSTKPGQDEEKHGEYVLLTGATGALGAHILHLLRSRAKISRITCLVRAASPLAAHERVSKSLIARGKPGLPPFSDSKSTLRQDSASPSATVICSPASLSDRDLALHPSIYTHLTHTTTLIIHAAWAVNFTARLRSFEKDHVAGLSHLLNLAHSSSRNRQSPRFLFLSSTASVTNTPATDHPIPERISTTPTDASPLGYSRSKWVAESICASYSNRVTSPSPQSNPKAPKANIAILRIGQLTSDTEHGIWNISEAWPLMLSTAPALHALPDLGDQALDWLPVDTAAKAVLEVAESMKDVATDDGGVENADTTSPQIFHILNPSSSPTWSDLLAAIKDASPVLDLDVLPPREWLQRLERFEGDLPAKKLVGVWEKAFAGERGGGQVVFGVERAKEVSMVMREVGPLDEMFLERMWRWVEGLAAGCGGKVEGE